MTIEYFLLLVVVFGIGLKSFFAAPREAFKDSAPRLGARIEKHLVTGREFSANHKIKWTQAK